MRGPLSLILTFALTLAWSLPGRAQSASSGQNDAPQERLCVNVSVETSVVVEVNTTIAVNIILDADDVDGGVTLAWATGTEPDTAGFNVYRLDAEGSYSKINDALIPAQGDLSSGGRYTFVDRPGVYNGARYDYMLESMSINGKRKPRAIVSASHP